MRERISEPCRATAEVLPWYVNGTLEPDELESVERHLAGCDACRAELARCRETASAIPDGETLAPAVHPSRLARLMERLGAPDEPEAGDRRLGIVRAWRRRTAQAAPPVRWLVAAQLVVITVLGTALVLAALALGTAGAPGPAGEEASFRTLGDEDPGAATPAASGTLHLRVVFDPGTPEEDLRALLLEVRGQLVGGPSPLGAYTLAVPAGGPEADPLEVVLDHLREQPAVRFAEPVAAP